MGKKREIERRFLAALPVELRAGEGDRPAELSGYASVFNQDATIQDWWGDAWVESVAPGAYAKTIGEADIRALFNHDASVVLGRNRAGTLVLAEDATGLHDVIRPPDNEWGRPVLDAVRRGDVTGQSIAFQVIKEQWTRPSKRGELARRTILEVKLFDVSVVTYPAFEMTSVAARSFDSAPDGRSAQDDNVRVIEQAFRLARLAEHGYPLEADERQMIGAAAGLLRAWAGEPGGDGLKVAGSRFNPEADHSNGHGAEPVLRFHSADMRARWLELVSRQLV